MSTTVRQRETCRRRVLLALGIGVAIVGLVACGDDPDGRGDAGRGSDTEGGADAAAEITPEGVGELRIGQTVEEALATGQAVDFVPTCSAAGEGFLAAELAGGLDGSIIANADVIVALSVRGGAATTEGMAPGDHLDTVSRNYPSEDYEVETDMTSHEAFDAGIVSIAQGGTTLYQAWVDPESEILTSIWVPEVITCD